MDVTIGIIAYNEENNIKNLIQSLQNQKLSKIKIKKIIVVSSGSTERAGNGHDSVSDPVCLANDLLLLLLHVGHIRSGRRRREPAEARRLRARHPPREADG